MAEGWQAEISLLRPGNPKHWARLPSTTASAMIPAQCSLACATLPSGAEIPFIVSDNASDSAIETASCVSWRNLQGWWTLLRSTTLPRYDPLAMHSSNATSTVVALAISIYPYAAFVLGNTACHELRQVSNNLLRPFEHNAIGFYCSSHYLLPFSPWCGS